MDKIKHETITFKQVEKDLKKATKQEIDIPETGLGYVVNVLTKLFSILVVFVLMIGLTALNKYTVINLMTQFYRVQNNSLNQSASSSDYRSINYEPQENFFNQFFLTIWALLVLPEIFSFFLYLFRYLTKKVKNDSLSFTQTIIHFSPIFFLDILSSISSTWFLFYIYKSCPSYLTIGLMLSSLWLPSVVSFSESVYYKFKTGNNFKTLNLVLDFIAVVLNTITFGVTISQFYFFKILQNSDEVGIMLHISIYFCPIFQFINVVYPWIYGAEDFFAFDFRANNRNYMPHVSGLGTRSRARYNQYIQYQDQNFLNGRDTTKSQYTTTTNLYKYSLQSNRRRISVISSLVKMFSSTICLILTQGIDSQAYEKIAETSKELTHANYYVLIIILSGFAVTALSYTILQLGDVAHILPIGCGPFLGNLVVILVGYFYCSGTEVDQIKNGLICYINDDAEAGASNHLSNAQLFTTLTYFFISLPAWIITCRHIYIKTPLKFLPFYCLFSCGSLNNSLGMTEILMTINRRRNNLTINDLKVKMFKEKVDRIKFEKDRLNKDSYLALAEIQASQDIVIGSHDFSQTDKLTQAQSIKSQKSIKSINTKLDQLEQTLKIVRKRESARRRNLYLLTSERERIRIKSISADQSDGTGRASTTSMCYDKHIEKDRVRPSILSTHREIHGNNDSYKQNKSLAQSKQREKQQQNVSFKDRNQTKYISTNDDSSAFSSSPTLNITSNVNNIVTDSWREELYENADRNVNSTQDIGSENDPYLKEEQKTPFIFICPTLYQEDETEIQTLVTSILRLNRYRLNNMTKNTINSSHLSEQLAATAAFDYDFNHQNPGKGPGGKIYNPPEFDFEINIFFDNCFINKIYRYEIPKNPNQKRHKEGSLRDVDLANKLITKDEKWYDSRGIVYKFIRPMRENTRFTLRENSGTLKPQMVFDKTMSLSEEMNVFLDQQSKETRADASEVVFEDEAAKERTARLRLISMKNSEGRIIDTPGLHYKLRQVNKFVEYLLKTMANVAEKIPFDTTNNTGARGSPNKKEKCKINPPIITFWPYGMRLEYELPLPNKVFNKSGEPSIKPTKFIVHLKDPLLIQKGKRWSQTMYFNYLYGYKTKTYDLEKTHDVMFLALDGDVDFQPDALTNCLYKLQAEKEVGFCCGKINPKGSRLNPLYYYQKFEYSVGHWFQKASEHIFGSVLCSPGCFSLIRAEALKMDIDGNRDSAIDVYSSRANKDEPVSIIQWNQGEDRWLCTLLLKRGWRISYVAISMQDTNAPMTLKEYFNQRRRWGPSTFFNIFDILRDWKSVVEKNPNMTSLYLLYTAVLSISGLLTVSTVTLLLLGCFRLLLETWGCSFCYWPWLPFALSFGPVIIFGLICLFSKDDNPKHTCVQILAWFYAMVMLNVLIIMIGDFLVPCGSCNLINQIFLFIVSLYVLAAILNPSDFIDLVYGLVYWLLMPTMLILLNIYMYFGLNNTSWGTRESDAQIKIDLKEKDKLYARWSCSLGSLCETNWLITQSEQLSDKDKIERDRKAQIKKELDKYNSYTELKEDKILVCAGNYQGKELAVPIEYNLSNILNNETYCISRENIEGRRLNQQAKSEEKYWKDIIEAKLKPKSQQETSLADSEATKKNLLDLRNNFVVFFTFINTFWVCAILGISVFTESYAVSVTGFFCEDYFIQNGTEIVCDDLPSPDENQTTTPFCHQEPTFRDCGESTQVNPLSLSYLYFYLLIMTIQSIGMIIHRWESFIVYCSSVNIIQYFQSSFSCFSYFSCFSIFTSSCCQNTSNQNLIYQEESNFNRHFERYGEAFTSNAESITFTKRAESYKSFGGKSSVVSGNDAFDMVEF